MNYYSGQSVNSPLSEQNNNNNNKSSSKQSKSKKVGRFTAIRNWLKQSKWKKKDKITNSNTINNLEGGKLEISFGDDNNNSILNNSNNKINSNSVNNISSSKNNSKKNFELN